ncbi:hypothetical protein OHB41_37230 [Streptomyces sp. NBC_01571]|uniref:hypothetical protein n=1 Tax=Streptomyces sp. NBC_01571 TaxID=2975883 RepID=UPI00224FB23F|nr:hypothetical protein [Streptomyces sp. NBC_01571]MCX4578732.1 hypothetical protein [Streptomyces sp. NBC_01571]
MDVVIDLLDVVLQGLPVVPRGFGGQIRPQLADDRFLGIADVAQQRDDRFSGDCHQDSSPAPGLLRAALRSRSDVGPTRTDLATSSRLP